MIPSCLQNGLDEIIPGTTGVIAILFLQKDQ
jgi:hypothetical protein